MTVAELEMTPDELKLRREMEALRAVPGYSVGLSDEQRVLASILRVAVSHDTVCQHLEHRMYRKLGIYGMSHEADHDDGEMGDLLLEAVYLSAALAPAALRRVPSPVFAKAAAGTGVIEGLDGDDLEEFMRPIFEESGLGERFEVRDGYEVYVRAVVQDAA